MCDLKPERAPVGIRWNDLQPMSRSDTIRELLLPVPWLLASLGLYATALWPLGFACAFMFFLCALRLNHEAIHGNLGLPRRGDFAVLHGLSFLMLGSNHAVAHGHMLHHRHAMGPEDFEGKCGDMSLGEVLVHGRGSLERIRSGADPCTSGAGSAGVVLACRDAGLCCRSDRVRLPFCTHLGPDLRDPL